MFSLYMTYSCVRTYIREENVSIFKIKVFHTWDARRNSLKINSESKLYERYMGKNGWLSTSTENEPTTD